MSTVGEINVRIGGDHRPLDQSLKESERRVDQFSGKISSLKGAFAGIVAGVGAQQMISFLSDSVKMAGEAEQALTSLQSTIKSTGGAAGYTAAQLAEYATELSKATVFDDDGIVNMMAVLGTFKNVSGETFKAATEAALDMSQKLDQDLQSSAIQLGKALNDPIAGITALTRAGIQFTEEQKNVIKNLVETGQAAKAQTIILAEIAGQMGGAARAAAKTYSGQLAQLKNEYDNLREEIGQTIVEVLASTGAMEGAKAAVEGVSSVIQANKGQISLLADSFRDIGKAVGWAGAQLNAFMSVWNNPAMQAAMGAAKGMSSGGPIGMVSGGLGGYNSAIKAEERAARLAADGDGGPSLIQQALANSKTAKFQNASYPSVSGGGSGGGSGSGGGKSRADALQELRDSLKTELELEQERYEKGMELAGGDAELREQLATDHAEKMKEIAGVGAWERELEGLQDKYKKESELETERYSEQMGKLAEFLDAKAITQEEYDKMAVDAEAVHQQLLTEITDKEAAKRAEIEKKYQDQINAMRASAVNLGIDLLNTFAGKSKAAAIAAVVLNKGLMIAQTIQNTAAAKMRAMAELGPIAGPPAAAAIGVMGAVQAGLIAATGIAQIASGSGSGSGSSSGVSTSSTYSGGTSSAINTGQQAGKTVTIYGLDKNSLYTGEQVAELLNEFLADGGTLNIR